MAFGLKRPLQSHACRLVSLYSFFLVFIMAGADDIIPDVSFAQEEADYEAALFAANPGGSNPQQSVLPELTTATPPGYESISYSYQPAALPGNHPRRSLKIQLSTLQLQRLFQHSEPIRSVVLVLQLLVIWVSPHSRSIQHLHSSWDWKNLLRQCDVKQAVIQAEYVASQIAYYSLHSTTQRKAFELPARKLWGSTPQSTSSINWSSQRCPRHGLLPKSQLKPNNSSSSRRTSTNARR